MLPIDPLISAILPTNLESTTVILDLSRILNTAYSDAKFDENSEPDIDKDEAPSISKTPDE